MFGIILDILEALPVFKRLAAFFRKSDTEKAKDVENKVDSLSNDSVDQQLRGKWER